MLKQIFEQKKSLRFDLLNPELEEKFALKPNLFKEEILAIKNEIEWVVVDEVQRSPKLLDLIHMMIEEDKIKFAITGSSARKLRRGGANLLAGRAFLNYIFPLTHLELKENFDLKEILTWGSLPKIFSLNSSQEKEQYLKSYVVTFIQEEIKAEQVVRRLDPFRRFLEVAAQAHAQIVNYSNIANDVGVDIKTVQTYFQILDDTMIGFYLEPFHTSVRKAMSRKPKFYFFDLGVQRTLAQQIKMIPEQSSIPFGILFESFFILECVRLNEYYQTYFQFYYLRTKDDAEIDLIIKRPGKKNILIEIKSGKNVSLEQVKKFSRLALDIKDSECFIASNEEYERLVEGICVIPWRKAIQRIFTSKFLQDN